MVALLLGGVQTVSAIPIEWTINDVAFGMGGSLTGSFVYDADYDDAGLQSFDLTASGGFIAAQFPGALYASAAGDPWQWHNDGTIDRARFRDASQDAWLYLYFDGYLTNSAGNVVLTLVEEEERGWDNNMTTRSSTAGYVSGVPVAAPVPEPATILFFGIGLLGIAGVSRRKK